MNNGYTTSYLQITDSWGYSCCGASCWDDHIPPPVANVLDSAGSTLQLAMTAATECVGTAAAIAFRVFVAIVACGKVVTSTITIAQKVTLPHLALVQV